MVCLGHNELVKMEFHEIMSSWLITENREMLHEIMTVYGILNDLGCAVTWSVELYEPLIKNTSFSYSTQIKYWWANLLIWNKYLQQIIIFQHRIFFIT